MSAVFAIDLRVVSAGLGFAAEIGSKPALFMIAPNRLRLAVAYDGCMVFSWELSLHLEAPSCVFVLPAHVARMLTGDLLGHMDTLDFTVAGQEVRLRLTGGDIPTELTWQWNPASLGAPAEFEHMLQLPQEPVRTTASALTAAVNRAVARVKPSAETPDIRLSLIPVEATPRTVSIGGQDLSPRDRFVAYFDPACLARAVARVAGSVSANGLDIEVRDFDGRAAFFTLAGVRQGWMVQCAVKSVMVERAAEAEPATALPRAPAIEPASPFAAPEPHTQPIFIAPPVAPALEPPAPPPAAPSPGPLVTQVVELPIDAAPPAPRLSAPDFTIGPDAAPPDEPDADQPAPVEAPALSGPLPDTRPHTALPTVAAFKDAAIPDTGMLPPDYLADIQRVGDHGGASGEDDRRRRPARDSVTLD